MKKIAAHDFEDLLQVNFVFIHLAQSYACPSVPFLSSMDYFPNHTTHCAEIAFPSLSLAWTGETSDAY
jgi:hypothetical protein